MLLSFLRQTKQQQKLFTALRRGLRQNNHHCDVLTIIHHGASTWQSAEKNTLHLALRFISQMWQRRWKYQLRDRKYTTPEQKGVMRLVNAIVFINGRAHYPIDCSDTAHTMLSETLYYLWWPSGWKGTKFGKYSWSVCLLSSRSWFI